MSGSSVIENADRTEASAAPVAASEFAALMSNFEPFERGPALAVGVSGGADSMALCLLADEWAKARGGRIVALTVDHGLRADSGREARQVGKWLRARSIRHRILRWKGPKPKSKVQEKARDARYALLAGWCRPEGVLHLLLAHHREDQAETFLMRLAHASGFDGLASMPALREEADFRILRPFLPIPRARLAATLRSLGQDWIDDPSNADTAFERVRIRTMLQTRADDPDAAGKIAGAAVRIGAARAAFEKATARLLALAAAPHPAGYVWLDPEPLASASFEIRRRALTRCLLAVSGEAYPPRQERLDRLAGDLARPLARGRTLGGCRILPVGRRLLVCRETRGEGERISLNGAGDRSGGSIHWDGRFDIEVRRPRLAKLMGGRKRQPRFTIGRLGNDGWARLVRRAPALRGCDIPAPVRPTLPALWRGSEPIQVPYLSFHEKTVAQPKIVSAQWNPRHAMMGPGFSVAESPADII